MNEITKTQGGIANDYRGSIRFVNDFDMAAIVSFLQPTKIFLIDPQGYIGVCRNKER